MAQSVLQQLLQRPDAGAVAAGGLEEEADWDWRDWRLINALRGD